MRGYPVRIQSAKARYTVNKGEVQTTKNRNGHADWNLGTGGLKIGRFGKHQWWCLPKRGYMSINGIAIFGLIFQTFIWTPVWLLLIADHIWKAFPFKVAALINIYCMLAPIIIAFALILWLLKEPKAERF